MIGVAAAVMALSGLDFAGSGTRLIESIEKRYWPIEGKQYSESITAAGEPGKAPAFTWDLAVYLSAAAAGCSLDAKKYGALCEKILDSLKPYGCNRNGVWGYSDLPVHGPQSDRYYDDNEWLVLAELEAYEATHRKRFLDEAERTFQFVMSGESGDLGGGIFWRENDRKSKNTCSNAPRRPGRSQALPNDRQELLPDNREEPLRVACEAYG
ncbi:MAG: glycoside hydrolase family 76 protein [Fimbriimonadales bacterium]